MGKLKAVGLNIFAGLFTVGVKRAGFDVLAHLEHGPYGVATAKKNFPKLDIRVGRENWNEREFRGLDLMYSNPPCAAFSLAGKGNWEKQDDRLRYIYDCVEAAVVAKPKAFLMESVVQAWTNGHSYITQQAERLCDAGFHVTVLLQNNKYMGCPQTRPRIFLIGHTHPLVWPKMTEPMTVAQALKTAKKVRGLETPETKEVPPKYAKLWKLAGDEGSGNLRNIDEAEMLPGPRISFLHSKVRANQPAPVMIAYDVRYHPTKPRYFEWHEWLALCGLPPDWVSSERRMQPAAAELARAVMPPVGQWVAKAVADGLKLPRLKGWPTTARVVDMRLGPDRVVETPLFTFDGFTQKLRVPPPIPAYVEKVRAGPRAPKGPSTRPQGIGARIRELLKVGKLDTAGILAKVKEEFPTSKATAADVAWNRGKLRAGVYK